MVAFRSDIARLASRDRWRQAALLLGFTLLLAARPGRADEVIWKTASFRQADKWLAVSLGFRELLDTVTRERLRNGFATTVVMRIYLYERDGGEPVAVAARTLKAVFDLWEEQFLLRVEEPGRSYRRKLRDERQVVDELTSLWNFPLDRLDRLRDGRSYFVAVVAEVNPMSETLLAEVRRWLRNPYGRQGGSDFFGSFVSIFVNNKIRSSERSLRLRTQLTYRKP